MRRSGIRLGSVLGIPLELDFSFFVSFTLIIVILGSNILPAMIDPDPSDTVLWGLALVAGVVFFVSLLLHELAHSLVARAYGMHVAGITLFLLGGVSRIQEDSRRAREELFIAIVGPLTSAVLGGIFLALYAGLPLGETPGAAVLAWLGIINISLAVFNMLPGFPMDGGRVLRAALWGITRSRARATRWAGNSGRLFGGLLALYGVIGVLGINIGVNSGGFGGLWLIFIGGFLINAATQAIRAVEAEEALGRLRVRDLMVRSNGLRTVEADTPLRFLVPNRDLLDHRLAFLATDNNTVVGLVPAAAILLLDEPRYRTVRLRDIMIRAQDLNPISPDASGEEALHRLQQERNSVLPVVEDGRLLGLVGLDQIMAALRRAPAPAAGP